jgi:hypothetical protein
MVTNVLYCVKATFGRSSRAYFDINMPCSTSLPNIHSDIPNHSYQGSYKPLEIPYEYIYYQLSHLYTRKKTLYLIYTMKFNAVIAAAILAYTASAAPAPSFTTKVVGASPPILPPPPKVPECSAIKLKADEKIECGLPVPKQNLPREEDFMKPYPPHGTGEPHPTKTGHWPHRPVGTGEHHHHGGEPHGTGKPHHSSKYPHPTGEPHPHPEPLVGRAHGTGHPHPTGGYPHPTGGHPHPTGGYPHPSVYLPHKPVGTGRPEQPSLCLKKEGEREELCHIVPKYEPIFPAKPVEAREYNWPAPRQPEA